MKVIRCFCALTIIGVLLFNSCSKKSSPIEETEGPGDGGGSKELVLPKKELRGVWIATVWSLDWPRTSDYTAVEYNAAAQKKSYTDMLDNIKAKGFNTVFVQVKGMGDAFYDSAYEPWSASLTGTRGKDPGYDVLKFMIDEAHLRGLDFHAWINPYRIATRGNNSTQYPPLHASVNPSWVVDHEKIQIYNPALPEVQARLADIVKDIITKYDVDGLHMDDYFYPDPAVSGTLTSDQSLYQQMGAGFSSIQAWRRANVDKAIEKIYTTIVANKPQVVFSISPAASKDYNLNTLYADVEKWCKNGWVDILIPQLYQEIGNSTNDFQRNLSVWSQYSYSAKLVIGHALYKFGTLEGGAKFDSPQELERQFEMTRDNAKVVGSVMYSAKDVYFNRVGVTDKLEQLYKHNAIIPFAGREVAPRTPVPSNFKLENGILSWDSVSGNDVRYAVYHFTDLTKQGKLVAVNNLNTLSVNEPGFYCVTSLNKDNLESKPSQTIEKK